MTDIRCPKCQSVRFIPFKAIFGYRRNWLGRWEKVRLADVSVCEGCRRVWEIAADTGSVSMLEDAPKVAVAPFEKDDKRREEKPIPNAIERPDV